MLNASDQLLMHITDEAIIANMEDKNYHIAIVLLAQMQKENGVLSNMNQFRMCQCLYFTHRYLAALEKAKKFISAGNGMPEMIFLRGMCHYQLGQYAIALDCFKRKREWVRWEKKAEMRKESSQSRGVVIGEMPTKAADEKATFEFKDSKKSIEIQINMTGVDPNILKVNLNELWLELTYDDGHRKFTKSCELYKKVVPKTLKLEVNDMFIKMQIEKEKEEDWPSLMAAAELAPDATWEAVLQKLNLVPEFTDEEAAELFEKHIAQLKEEAQDISKWFDSV